MNPFRSLTHLLLAALISLLLFACAGEKTQDVESGDGPSLLNIKAEDVLDATPRAEPLAAYGNHSPYEVFGKKYYVLASRDDYREQGVASWYGSKFHGRRTSSGEPYDMHLATAAHKTLPLPSYAEVTNLDNGRKVIVKINDRGPFKDDRLIDMSYGAALRLGMIASGTARVDLRVIDMANEEVSANQPDSSKIKAETWLQAGAYGRRQGAEQLASQLRQAALLPVSIHQLNELFRVWLGPYSNSNEVESVIKRAIELGFERPHKISR